MTPERWREVEQVYQSTVDREPRLRAAFLAEACGNDEELRREVDSLLELNQSPVLVDEPAWQAVAELLTDSTQLAPGTQLGPYRIEALLGAGGMGRVYQSHDTRLGRTVALKLSRVEFNARFEREARAVAALNHPNVCTIHDVGPNYLVMELVEGPTLEDRIKEGTIPLEEALRIARQIADALEAAHEKGIVHRDLKPGNIKIKPDGTVKVLDFGLAKLRPIDVAPGTKPEDSPTISMAATSAGMILGTAAYMSPEQARGKVVDKRADIWAFGVVLYEMVTGRRLFEGEDVTETLALVIKGEPKWDGIAANVQRLLKSCLEKDPKRRLRDIGDTWRQLDEAPATTVASRSRVGIAGWIVALGAVAVAAALAFENFSEKPPSAEVMRFQIPLPPQMNFMFATPYLSPDGRQVAFLSANAEGRTQLWVRSLDSLESRPLAGTEGVFNTAFWSPDSRFLGFVAQSKLKKVDVSGDSPLTVCDLPVVAAVPGQSGTFRSGAWNRDGVILFGIANSGLWRVSAAGGPPTEVTRLDPSRKELFHAGPDFLPGGRQFLYERQGTNAEYNGTYLGSLDAKPEQQSTRRLLSNAFGAVYVPAVGRGSSDGHLLFTREGSLMAQSFDLRRLKPAGEAVSIVQGMFFAGIGPRPFSASMLGVLAYRTVGFSEHDGTITQLTWFDRTGKMLATAGDRGQYNSLALSPDGTRVAVSRVSPETARGRSGRAAYEIWVYDFARGSSTRLTSDPASDWLATWSPDGRRIIFSSDRGGSVFNLYRKAADGAGSEDVVFSSNEDKSVQDWSRDGKFLLYSVAMNGRRSFFPTASHDLWVLPLTPVNPTGNQPEPYLKTEFNESQGRFSPDGRFVAYVSDASGRYEIYVQPFPTAFGSKTIISTAGGVSPRWRSDGKELYYISADSKMMAVEVSTSPIFKAGIPRPLFQAPIWGGGTFHNVTRYDVTADGKRFLINRVTADAATSAPAPITIVLNWTALLKK
jgi:eukaryotic-like serine/threonine-protein kinase